MLSPQGDKDIELTRLSKHPRVAGQTDKSLCGTEQKQGLERGKVRRIQCAIGARAHISPMSTTSALRQDFPQEIPTLRNPAEPVVFSMVDLDADREKVECMWLNSQGQFVKLSLAAAFLFHKTRRGTEQALTGIEYDGALDIAATVIACLIPVYTVDEQKQWTAVIIDLSLHEFRGGATQLQRSADGATLAPMSVVRDDVGHALQEVSSAGFEIAYRAPRRPQAPSLLPPLPLA